MAGLWARSKVRLLPVINFVSTRYLQQLCGTLPTCGYYGNKNRGKNTENQQLVMQGIYLAQSFARGNFTASNDCQKNASVHPIPGGKDF